MRDLLFTVDFHLTVISILAMLVSIFLVAKKFIDTKKKFKKLALLKDKNKWDEVKIKVESKGYFVNYPYPNSYSREYGVLSELQKVKAASFEFENYKLRLKKERLENESGKTSIFYRDENKKLYNRISLTNNPDVNYNHLMLNENKDAAFRNKDKPSMVVLKIPDENEIRIEGKRMFWDTLKTSFVYIGASSLIVIAAFSY